jgi:hypothetical protein
LYRTSFLGERSTKVMALLVNFARQLTPVQVAQIERLAERHIEEVRDVPVQVDQEVSSMHQEVSRLLKLTAIAEGEWKTLDVLVILPGLSIVAALLAIELQFLCGAGHLQLVRFKPVGTAVTDYVAAEILAV